jgi:hypothetical protein
MAVANYNVTSLYRNEVKNIKVLQTNLFRCFLSNDIVMFARVPVDKPEDGETFAEISQIGGRQDSGLLFVYGRLVWESTSKVFIVYYSSLHVNDQMKIAELVYDQEPLMRYKILNGLSSIVAAGRGRILPVNATWVYTMGCFEDDPVKKRGWDIPMDTKVSLLLKPGPNAQVSIRTRWPSVKFLAIIAILKSCWCRAILTYY